MLSFPYAWMVSMTLLWIVYVVGMPMILEYEIYDLIISIPIHDRYYDDHVLHEIPHSCIMDFYWWSCTQEIQVGLVSFHLVLGVLAPEKYSCVPRTISFFTIFSVKPWSIEFSQSCDSGKLRNLSNLSSPVISVISFLSNLSNLSIHSKSQ